MQFKKKKRSNRNCLVPEFSLTYKEYMEKPRKKQRNQYMYIYKYKFYYFIFFAKYVQYMYVEVQVLRQHLID